MKKTIILLAALLLLGNNHPIKAQEMETFKQIFPQGEAFKSDNFTGNVWLGWLVEKEPVFNSSIANVTFEPGCRNNWHSHPGGQILLCTAGEGYYQEEGKPIQLLKPGDVVKIVPNIKHWHGATPTSWFSHISIESNPGAGPAVWMEPVTDEEYNNYQQTTRTE
ncbi:MAG: cupin domain-containing protein [Tannerellaceae bacterium]|nr:cupin domain-containing protein [Tannerellaceae bacterium]